VDEGGAGGVDYGFLVTGSVVTNNPLAFARANVNTRLVMGGQEEAIVPLPGTRAQIPPATAYRSTWVVSSLNSLRYHGLFERYLGELREHRDEILSCVAGTWLPVARSHYRACDALGLSDAQIMEIVRGPGAQVRRAWYARLIAAAEQANENPWAMLAQLERNWRRGVTGSAVAVFRLGPKEARVEYVACELFRFPYYCEATRVVLLSLVERFGAGSVRTLRQRATDEAHYQLHWV